MLGVKMTTSHRGKNDHLLHKEIYEHLVKNCPIDLKADPIDLKAVYKRIAVIRMDFES